MTRRRSSLLAPLLTCGLLACIRPDAPNPVSAGRIELSASDWSGEPVSPQRLPLKPQLTLRAEQAFAPAPDAVLLFEGAPDSALISDLAQAPLRDEHRARLVASEIAFGVSEAVLSPRAALSPDVAYTLAVPVWVRSQGGATLLPNKAPLVYRLRTGSPPSAGARVVGSWPAEGATAIGTNLGVAVIALDGFIEDAERGTWLEGPDGLALETEVVAGPCVDVAPEQPAIFCVRMTPYARLAPNADHALVVGTDARDTHGAPVGPWRAQFRSAAGSDSQPPAIVPLTCAIDEQSVEPGCVLIDDASVTLRLEVNEPAVAMLRIGDKNAFAIAPNGDASLRVSGLAADADLALELSLRDSSGNEQREQLSLRTRPPLATLAIVETRADALGPEPQQEFVELLNYGTDAVDLLGFVLDDRNDVMGTPIARSLVLAPQTRALLVADGFDPSDPHDVAPPPGTPLLRIGRALAGSGLSNAGSALFLRDPEGNRVSAAPATPVPKPGVCLVRTSADMRDGSTHTFSYDDHDTCTPGR